MVDGGVKMEGKLSGKNGGTGNISSEGILEQQRTFTCESSIILRAAVYFHM